MVLEMLFSAVAGVVRAIFGLVPVWEPDVTEFQNSWDTILSWMGNLNQWIPVSTLLVCLGVVLAYRLVLVGYRIIKTIWDSLPLT